MTHALLALRQAIRAGTPIDDSEPGVLKIGDAVYNLNEPVEYLASRGKGQAIYNLDAIWFMYMQRNETFTDYSTLCKGQHHRSVIYSDRTDLLAWFAGQKEEINGLKKAVQEAPAVEVPEEHEPVREEEPEEEHHEEPEREEEHEEEVQPPPPPAIDRGPVVEYERLRPLDSVLLCARDFSEIQAINNVITRRGRDTEETSGNKSFMNPVGPSSFDPTPQPAARPGRIQSFIILVPMSNQSKINNSNIEKFLLESQWVPPTVDMSNKRFVIQHNHSDTLHTTNYEIIGDEKLLKEDDWNRVVAIFLMGKPWQIKNYKPSDPAVLFPKVLGIYVGWDTESLPNEIQNWRIKEFKINQQRRHADAQVVARIWHEIEDATTALKKGKVK